MRWIGAWLLVAARASRASRSPCTTLVPADFAQMARESELIVHGTVVNVQSQMTGPRADDRKRDYALPSPTR